MWSIFMRNLDFFHGHPKPSLEPIKFNFTYLKLNGLFRKRLSLKEILLRNKEEKRRKKNESSRRSYNKLHKSAITLSTGDIVFLKLRTVGNSGDLRDKHVEITAHLLLGDAGKLSFNFLRILTYS
jgi:hypothetical protein